MEAIPERSCKIRCMGFLLFLHDVLFGASLLGLSPYLKLALLGGNKSLSFDLDYLKLLSDAHCGRLLTEWAKVGFSGKPWVSAQSPLHFFFSEAGFDVR